MSKADTIVLALYPNAKGLGYVCIEQSQKILDSGIVTTRLFGSEKLLARIKRFIDFYRPTTILLRNPDMPDLIRSSRVKALLEGVNLEAENLHLPTYSYSRQQIKDVFGQFGATTKNEIAQKIIEWFPELDEYTPKIRKPWMEEDYYMRVFDAMALAITHQYLGT